jgi:hypothetical protein
MKTKMIELQLNRLTRPFAVRVLSKLHVARFCRPSPTTPAAA